MIPEKDVKYRVERWVEKLDSEVNDWKHKEHVFDSLEEAEGYIKEHKAIYRLKVFRFTEELVMDIASDWKKNLKDEA